jgi:hypothetical protein
LRNVTLAPSLWERRGWTRKIRAYLEYFKSEAYRTKYEGRRARVLTITAGAGRLHNMKQATEALFDELTSVGEDPKEQGRLWFTTFEDAPDSTKLLSTAIWYVAGSDHLHSVLE